MMRNKNFWILVALLPASALFGGCNGGSDDENGGPGGDIPKKVPFPAEQATVSISGMVRFEGQAPIRKKLNVTSDHSVCHPESAPPPLSETLIVNGNGTVKNVVVYVSKGLARYRFEKNTTPAKFDQVRCVYVPHVQPVQVGQPLHVRSSDDTSHNVHWKSEKNGDMNISQTSAGMVDVTSFKVKRQEIGTARFECEIHGWMTSYVPIFKHPFFAMTGDDGSYSLPKRLPAGKYTLSTWHEKLGTKSVVIEVKDGESKTVDFSYAGKPGD